MSFFSHKIKCRKRQTCNQTGGQKYWNCISHQTHHHLHCIVALVRGKRGGGLGGGGGGGGRGVGGEEGGLRGEVVCEMVKIGGLGERGSEITSGNM